ncbi:hypothetical protein H920_02648 [Fukomys damarensis]|uniref:Uncharacterized protein n=1 Tax=Fukomys damarensis TaxID=885580 RepID=A0A091DXY3_FUKDA|nr:hypothetical protein H920_02648 [Fukomys damarensis]
MGPVLGYSPDHKWLCQSSLGTTSCPPSPALPVGRSYEWETQAKHQHERSLQYLEEVLGRLLEMGFSLNFTLPANATDFPSLSLFAKVFPLLAAMTYPWLLKPCGSPETQALSHPGLAYHQHNTEKPSMGTAGVRGSEDVTF